MAINIGNVYLVQLDAVSEKVIEAQKALEEANHLAYSLPAFSPEREAIGKAIALTIHNTLTEVKGVVSKIEKVHHGVASHKMAAPHLNVKRRVEALTERELMDKVLMELHIHLHGDWKCVKENEGIICKSHKFGDISVTFEDHGKQFKVNILSVAPASLMEHIEDTEIASELPMVKETFEKTDPDFAETIALMVKHEADKQAAYIPTLIKKFKIRMASAQKIASLEARLASLQALILNK